MEKVTRDILQHQLGMVLNGVLIMTCTIVVWYSIHHEKLRAEDVVRTALRRTVECRKGVSRGAPLDQEAEDLRDYVGQLVTGFGTLDWNRAKGGDAGVIRDARVDQAVAFATGLPIERLLIPGSEDPRSIERGVAQQVRQYYYSHQEWLSNQAQLKLWVMLSWVYLLGVMLVERVPGRLSQSEAMLNVIDVGLYSTLIGYTGGLRSWFLMILVVPVIAMSWDLLVAARIRDLQARPTRPTEHALPKSRAVLYAIAMLGSLIWSSLDSQLGRYGGQLSRECVVEYVKILLLVVVVGLLLGGFVHLALRKLLRERPDLFTPESRGYTYVM